MAEYIEFHCPYGDDFEGGDECDRCEKYELCMETPNADVVERSKIDNAIEEIKQEIQNGTIKITSGNEKLFNILENIGE